MIGLPNRKEHSFFGRREGNDGIRQRSVDSHAHGQDATHSNGSSEFLKASPEQNNAGTVPEGKQVEVAATERNISDWQTYSSGNSRRSIFLPDAGVMKSEGTRK